MPERIGRPMKIRAVRYHDFSAGHRVVGHENKCRWLHGHNYRVTFYCESDGSEALDKIGRVIDFGVIKDKLCWWVEAHWDHRFLMWQEDPWLEELAAVGMPAEANGVFYADFNPTAENMAEHLLNVVGPDMLKDTGVVVTKVIVEETRKCSAEAEL